MPTEEAARLALRTQQILAYESGVTNTVDPAGGSYAIEVLTDDIEKRVVEYLKRIDAMGGMLTAIESGWVQSEIQEAAYQYQKSIEARETIVVGVNEFRAEEEEPIPIYFVDPVLERTQIQSLSHTRLQRNSQLVHQTLQRLENAARSSDNLMPCILEAVEAYATLGEISDTFRKIYGEYREAAIT